MPQSSPELNESVRWAVRVLVTTLLLVPACSKPKAFAPSDDFARRHSCPASRVRHEDEGSERVRVSGCGESDTYVRRCENSAARTTPSPDPQRPLTESEARLSMTRFNPAPGSVGCAWSRESDATAPLGPTGGE